MNDPKPSSADVVRLLSEIRDEMRKANAPRKLGTWRSVQVGIARTMQALAFVAILLTGLEANHYDTDPALDITTALAAIGVLLFGEMVAADALRKPWR
jgi:hypothetical protein